MLNKTECQKDNSRDLFDIQAFFFTKLILNLYLQSLAKSISCPAFTNISTMHRRKKRQTSAKRHDDIMTPQLLRYNKLDSSSSAKTLLRKFGRFRACSGYLRMTQMTLLKGLMSARSKTVCEIRIADKERTEKLSKISLRRQSKFTKSERLCSINVVLSY